MSDFVAVLKRTLQGLGETTPEMRQRVYDKARNTISAKLEAMNPPASPVVVSRQRRALEDAIAEVESAYGRTPASREPLDELEQVLNSLNGLKDQGTPAKVQPPARPAETPRPTTSPARSSVTASPSRPAPARPQERRPVAAPEDMGKPETVFDQPVEGVVENEVYGKRRGGIGKFLIAAVILAALGGGGYAGWLHRDRIAQLAAEWLPSQGTSTATQTPTPAEPAPSANAPASPEETPPPAQQAQQPAPEPAAPPAGPVKFTQKLNSDGSETDAGPSSTGSSVGEGTSVATATQPAGQSGATGDQPPPAQQQPADPQTATPDSGTPPETPGEPAENQPDASQPPQTAQSDQPAPDQPAASGQPAVPVAQKAIFYEERTNSAAGSAEPGSIVWSVVQESPGADQPPEPAIRAEATIPSKDIQLRMTIRRNADKTLPASHIIELIFITPPNFDGGGVSSVVRIALKGSEQDAGTPLAGIPAKISDGFFLIALNDSQNDVTQNMRLMEDRSWLDVPLVYNSGRRALITMEKGVPGDKVFTDVLKSWGVPTSG